MLNAFITNAYFLFKNKDMSMIVIVPNGNNSLQNLVGKLASYKLEEIKDGGVFKEVQLSLPRFKIESTLELEDPLTEVLYSQIFFFLAFALE